MIRFASSYPRCYALPLAMGLLLGTLSLHAQACAGFGQRANLVINEEVVDDHRPGIVLSNWIGFYSANIAQVRGCTEDALPMEISPSFAGLTAVGSVEYQGVTYVTYQVSATSPLLIFRHLGYPGGGSGGSGFHYTPITVGTRAAIEGLRRGSNIAINSTFNVAIVSRGGSMQSASADLGMATTWLRDHPGFVMQHPASVTLTVKASTCDLSDASAKLADVNAADLAVPGDFSAVRQVRVAMACPHAGVPVKLTLTDANDPSNRGSQLAPTANATASAVRVQLLRDDLPVEFGQQWDHGLSASTQHDVTLQARYIRTTGTFAAGVVEGQAILTATYR
ncbi:fimbrial protein [Stenotrophomonas pavanii]|nr:MULTISPECIES: fimbrial protein [Stenotrophomonas]MDZ7476900.1 fimbrial protein [Stenotrophomonas pavanii]